jgi:uncharacterized protein GlcG (DUF336 family)
VDLDRAQEVIAKARAEADRIGVPMTVAVVDAGGHLVAFARMDGVAFLTNEIAIAKAYTAAGARTATSNLEQALAAASHIVIGLATASGGRFLVIGGGAPIRDGDEVVGAVGASGGSAEQDQQVADAAAS